MTMPGTRITRLAGELPVPDAALSGRPPVAIPPLAVRSRVPRLASALAVLASLLNLVSALLPAERG
jgi:hypothetical protein